MRSFHQFIISFPYLVILVVVSAGCGSQPLRTAQTVAPTVNILVATEFPNGQKNIHDSPALPALSTKEKQTLLDELNALPRMSVFLPSSCHDRAHALWMQLSKAIQPKMAKTWVFSESAYSSLFRGGLVLKGVAMKPWRYHVALVFRDTDGKILVLDPVRTDWPNPTPLSEWLSQIERSPMSLLPVVEVTIKPDLYLFFGHPNNAAANNPAALNTGAFFEYTGLSRDKDYVPRSLSRDDVAVSNEARRCLDLQGVIDDADRLQQVLNCARESDDTMCTQADQTQKELVQRLQANCSAVVTLFRGRFEFWKDRLK